jgi:hypothetical protein
MNTICVETSDISLAAALRVYGYVLSRIDKEDRRGIFVFINVDEEILSKYNLGQLLVEPNAFHSAIKHLTMAVKRV